MSDFEILDGVGGAALKVRLPIASRVLIHEVVLSARAPSEWCGAFGGRSGASRLRIWMDGRGRMTSTP